MENSNQITVMGIGRVGCRVIKALLDNPSAKNLKFLALDTDINALNELDNLPDSAKLLAGAKWREGRGCGGSVLDGQRAVARERAELEQLLENVKLLVVVGGLGGGTCSGGAPVVLSVAKKLNIPSIFIVTMPFSLEGHSRRKIAEDVVKDELLPLAEALICLPNDLLFSVLDPNTKLEEAFQLADAEVASSCLAITSVLPGGNLLSMDYNDLSALLKRKKSFCSVGVGRAETAVDGAFAVERSLERMFHSPLLGGLDKLAEADAVLVSVQGGPELSLGDAKHLLDQFHEELKTDASILVGASTSENFAGKLQICVVTIKFEQENLVDDAPKKITSRNPKLKTANTIGDMIQDELPLLETVSKGIMENTTPVIYNGENLDIPTFKRRNLLVDNGKLVGE